MKLSLAMSVTVLLSLAACMTRGTPPSPPAAADVADAKRPLRCGSLEQCNRWWRTAQVWIVRNGGRVQVASDAIVQSAPPEFGSATWSFLATRAPHPDGGESIEIEARCAASGVCSPAQETAIADFKRSVLATR